MALPKHPWWSRLFARFAPRDVSGGLLAAGALACLSLACDAPPTARSPRPPPPSTAAPAAPTAPAAGYPLAPTSDLVETLHGVRVADPYRGLEDLRSASTRSWLDAEKAFTDRWFEGAPGRERIAEQLVAASNYERRWAPKQKGKRWFFRRQRGVQDQPVLYVADAPTAEGRPVLDFSQITSGGAYAVVNYQLSPRGTYVAYGLSKGGSDWVEWHVREVATGRDLSDRAEWSKYYPISWSADETSFYYSAFAKPPSGQELTAKDANCAVRRHRLGTETSADPIVYERRDHPTWQFYPQATSDGRYLVITTGDGEVGDRGTEEIHLLDLKALGAKVTPLVEGFDAAYTYVTNEGSTFYLKTTNAAPKGRVIAVDARSPARPTWKTIVPEGNSVIAGVERAGGRLVVMTQVDTASRLHHYSLDGRTKTEVTLPGVGTAVPLPSERGERASMLYFYTSFDAPFSTYRYDFATGKSEPLFRPHVALDLSTIETRLVFYTSKDGTRVPMYVVHKEGLAFDGKNPTLMTGYGGSIISVSPSYNPEYAWWLSIGGVLAMPGLRGGSEYGEAWARAAEKTKKQVTFDDFIAAAEWLIAQKITSPSKLATWGGSNGGLLVAASMVQRPELFGAVVVQVGVLDMLRFHLAGQGAGWTGPYGSPDVPEEFRALYAYSPLHNVKPGTSYPATLVATGENDTRVVPWHSYKFTAALQAAQAGPAPVLLRVQSNAGHFGGTTLAAALRDQADIYGFLLKVLDVKLP